MADEYTPNYNFFVPEGSDSMADIEKNMTTSLETLESRAAITVIAAGAALPQVGSYVIGDRVFRNDAQSGSGVWPSNYILVCKDANWGWHWRPIQQVLSPWVDVPATAIEHVSFELHPTIKFQIALDSKGYCHWRGCIRTKTPGMVANSTFVVFKNIPVGIRPNVELMHTVALSPVQSAAGKAGNVGARINLINDGSSSFRFFNSNNGVSQNIWLDNLSYNNSDSYYYGS